MSKTREQVVERKGRNFKCHNGAATLIADRPRGDHDIRAPPPGSICRHFAVNVLDSQVDHCDHDVRGDDDRAATAPVQKAACLGSAAIPQTPRLPRRRDALLDRLCHCHCSLGVALLKGRRSLQLSPGHLSSRQHLGIQWQPDCSAACPIGRNAVPVARMYLYGSVSRQLFH